MIWPLAPKVEITSSANSQKYIFPFNNWMDDKNGLDHVIYRDGVQGNSAPMQEYRVSVYTSDVRCERYVLQKYGWVCT